LEREAEEARIAAEINTKRLAEEEHLQKEAELARIVAEQEAKRVTEDARLQNEEEEARIAAEVEAQRVAEEYRLQKEAEEARILAEEEANRKAKEAWLQNEAEEARIAAEAESIRVAEEERLQNEAEDVRIAAEADAKILAEEERLRKEAELSRIAADEEERLRKGTEEARIAAEEEDTRVAEESQSSLSFDFDEKDDGWGFDDNISVEGIPASSVVGYMADRTINIGNDSNENVASHSDVYPTINTINEPQQETSSSAGSGWSFEKVKIDTVQKTGKADHCSNVDDGDDEDLNLNVCDDDGWDFDF